MFEIAVSLGVLSYLLFGLGLLGLLYKSIVVVITCLYVVMLLFYFKQSIIRNVTRGYALFKEQLRHPFTALCLLILTVAVIINGIGALGPELGFDALWYHLTLPKLYLVYHSLIHVPGGLLVYSDMPKLIEMLYNAALAIHSEIIAKIVHFFFGILCCIALYRLARVFVSKTTALLTVVIFYTNLVVGWESISAYIDLARTFFEILALVGIAKFAETKDRAWLFKASVSAGLALASKLLAIGSIGVFAVLLFIIPKESISQKIKYVLVFLFISLLIAAPWFIFSFIHTGNPVYPLFYYKDPTQNYLQLLNPLYFLGSTWELFTHAADPLSPLYLALLPVVVMYRKALWSKMSLLIMYAIGGFIVWYIVPNTGGGRYILPYLPAFSLIIAALVEEISSKKIKLLLVLLIFVTAMISIGYRAFANAKFLPVIFGRETKATFLTNHLNFSYGDFYDVDGFFAKNITKNDTVLLYGFHNLYYIDFPFIDSSWVEKGNTFTYVAVQGVGIPERFKYWPLIYFNSASQVRVYSLHKVWVY